MDELDESVGLLNNLDILGRYVLKEGIDLNNRVIFLNYTITAASAGRFLKGLKFLESYNQSPITIVITSPGGSVYDGLAIVDAIQSSPCEITTVATGLVASMAVPILSCAKRRKMTYNAYLMYHEISVDIPLSRISTSESEAKHSKSLNAHMHRLIAANSRKPYHYWAKVGKHVDYYIDADKALELGLVDEVI